jgi:hypothetical protein
VVTHLQRFETPVKTPPMRAFQIGYVNFDFQAASRVKAITMF